MKILRENMSKDQLRANDMAPKKGALSWLGCLLLKREEFVFNSKNSIMEYKCASDGHPSICPTHTCVENVSTETMCCLAKKVDSFTGGMTRLKS